MTLLDNFYKAIMNWFGSSDPKWDPDQVQCSVDEDPVDCFTFQLEEKGFHYDETEEWWERTWYAKTKAGEETSKEVYKQEYPSGKWVSKMYGEDGQLFFEQTVGTRTDGYETV